MAWVRPLSTFHSPTIEIAGDGQYTWSRDADDRGPDGGAQSQEAQFPGLNPWGTCPFCLRLPWLCQPHLFRCCWLSWHTRPERRVGDDPSPPQICVGGHSDCSSYYFIEHLLDAKRFICMVSNNPGRWASIAPDTPGEQAPTANSPLHQTLGTWGLSQPCLPLSDFRRILSFFFKQHSLYFSNTSELAKDFIRRLLVKDPK